MNGYDNWRPAAIVLDRSLPDVDGIEVCRWIRERSAAAIIMVSARDRPEDIALARKAGADSYLIEPFDYPELAVRLKVFIATWANCDLRGL